MPPLRYGDVHRLKRELPELAIEINGGFTALAEVTEQLARVDGVMIGRAAYENPWMLALADREIFGDPALAPTRREVVEAMLGYLDDWRRRGEPLGRIARHLLGLFAGEPGARAWRRRLSEGIHLPGAGVEVVRAALAALPDAVLDARPDAAPLALAAAGPHPETIDHARR